MAPLIQHFYAGNSRLVYKKFDRPLSMESNWKKELENLEEKLLSFPQLEMAHNQIHFYFFSPSDNSEFNEGQVWLGREIVGFLDPDKDHGFQVYDLYQGEGLEMTLPGGIEFSMERVKEFEGIFRELAEKHHFPVASTWRLSLNENHVLTLQMFKDIG